MHIFYFKLNSTHEFNKNIFFEAWLVSQSSLIRSLVWQNEMACSDSIFHLTGSLIQGHPHRILGVSIVVGFYLASPNCSPISIVFYPAFFLSIFPHLITLVLIPICPQSTHDIYSSFLSQGDSSLLEPSLLSTLSESVSRSMIMFYFIAYICL